MLGKINLQNYEKCYPKRLKRYFQSDLNYKTYNSFVPYTERPVVGNIPVEIIKLFKPNERGEKIKRFQEVLSEVSQVAKKGYDLDKMNNTLQSGLKNILEEGIKPELEYVDYGGYKKVYRLGLKNKDGKKIMHDKAFHLYNMSNDVYKGKNHGVYAEPNAWFYLQKNMGHPADKTQFTKHYISDLKNGYSLTEFVDEDIPKTTNEFNSKKILGLILTDRNTNPKLRKKVYDIGGLIKSSDAINDRTTLKYFKKIANRNTPEEREKVVNQLTEKVKNPRTPLRDKILTALKYYKELPPWYWNLS